MVGPGTGDSIMTLSDTARVVLCAAAQHEMGLARAPKTLPAAARNAVFKSLIKNNLLTEINAPREHVGLGWRQDDDGTWIVARITDEGLRAIGIDPNEANAVDAAERGGLTEAEYAAEQALAQEALDAGIDLSADAEQEDTRPRHEQNGVDEALIYGPTAEWQQPAGDEALLEQALAEGAPRGLKAAAQAVLTAWDASSAEDATDNPISRAIERLRAALAGKPARQARDASAPRKPREGTKQEAVLALLRREEGATVAQIAEATGWAAHTVRGFFAGLKKKGHEVQVLERVRMVGPNKEGAKGSYTVYHLPA
jgi:hypothetical protein